MQIPGFIRQHAGEVILGGSFVLGIALIAFPLWKDWTWDHGFIVALGTALMIAPIIAVGIEKWMTQRIAKDVFRAAFGYGFPGDFKEAIERIASYGVLCTKHIMSVRIRDLDANHVIIFVSIERHFENISASSQDIRAFTWIDEWGIQNAPSEILRCELYDGSGRLLYSIKDTKLIRRENLSFERTTPTISIRKHETCSVLCEYKIARRRNDFIYEQFTAPTRNPEIHIITAPDELDTRADFGAGKFETAHLPYRYQPNGVYFGPAPMKIRWWPRAASENWPSQTS
jgi:hypothetical protein